MSILYGFPVLLYVHHGVLYLESELGLDKQAIIKDGDKLLLMLNPDFSDFDQEMLNQLRKLTAVMESKKTFCNQNY